MIRAEKERLHRQLMNVLAAIDNVEIQSHDNLHVYDLVRIAQTAVFAAVTSIDTTRDD
jgi:hypothetical protein